MGRTRGNHYSVHKLGEDTRVMEIVRCGPFKAVCTMFWPSFSFSVRVSHNCLQRMHSGHHIQLATFTMVHLHCLCIHLGERCY